ncbi:MAG: hypothetical protein LBS28_02105 [Streptococcaceae bacterium]|nr:hypothetical protein [Streptococcaceae bacterium]
MNITTLKTLLTTYNQQKKFKKDAYYAIKQLSDQEYELERTIIGPCEESICAPTIKIKIINNKLVPCQLTDLKTTPIRL